MFMKVLVARNEKKKKKKLNKYDLHNDLKFSNF
jgi:hypothetical protein